jgi:DNA-binding Lrp family transcriptional regulator
MLDELDAAIIDELQRDARRPTTQIARELGHPTATVRDRIKRLEDRGVIQGYTAVVDMAKVSLPIKALVHISTSGRAVKPDAFLEAIGKIPEVASADLVTGSYEAMVTLYVRDIEHLSHLLYDQLIQIPGVVGTNTSIALVRRKWQIPRPIDSPPASST